MTDHIPHPDQIYRLASRAEWQTLLTTGQLPLRPVDEDDGYVHMSTGRQVLQTANLYFTNVAEPMVLRLDGDAMADKLKWEASRGGDLFPHYYGTVLKAHLIGAVDLVCGEDGLFRFGGTL